MKRVTEGYVTSFIPMPYDGHGYETFSVNGYHFSYADNIKTPWFNYTSSNGGPIKPGLYVRITFISFPNMNAIVKLEKRLKTKNGVAN